MQRNYLTILRNYIWDFVFLFVLFSITCISFLSYHYPLNAAGGDSNRDYLIAHHMVIDNEYPVVGPHRNFIPIKNSPFYSYILYALVSVFDNYTFVNYINILFQLINIIFIYLCVRKISSSLTGVLTILLYWCIYLVRMQFAFMWQPHLMMPFLSGSLLLLIYAYSLHKKYLVYLSFVLYGCAVAIHNSAIGILPIYSFLVGYLLYLWKQPVRTYLFTAIYLFVAVMVFYIPLLFVLQDAVDSKNIMQGRNSMEFSDHFQFLYIGLRFLRIFFNQSLLLFGTFTISILLFMATAKHTCLSNNTKKLLGMCVVITFLYIGALSFFTRYQDIYFLPILPFIAYGISEICYRLIRINKLFRCISLVLYISLTVVISNGYKVGINTNHSENKSFILGTAAIKKEIDSIPKPNGMADVLPFKVIAFRGQGYPLLSAVWWIGLEKEFNQSFVRIAHGSFSLMGYTEKETKKYIFLACHNIPLQYIERDCIKNLKVKYPYANLIKGVYKDDNVQIMLFEKS